jgi:hypothetical protein
MPATMEKCEELVGKFKRYRLIKDESKHRNFSNGLNYFFIPLGYYFLM